MVVQLVMAGVKVLYVSDSGFLTEQWLLEHAADLRSDILIKGRHARDLSGTPDFVAAVQPQVIVISGQDPFNRDRYAHEWRESMAAMQIPILDQDETGAVEIAITSGEFEVQTFLGDQTIRKSSR